MATSSWALRPRAGAALATLGLAVLIAGAPAGAQTLQVGFSQSLRGGVTTDTVSIVSSERDEIAGEARIQMPRGARVNRAFLYSGLIRADTTLAVPAGPTGFTRRVVLGDTARFGSETERVLQGMPDFSAGVFSVFKTDVTAAVRAVTGASAAGGLVRVPLRERGDAHYNHTNYPQYLGHTLVVVYDLDYAPLRSVVVFEGAANAGFTSPSLRLPAAAANRCGAMATSREEPFAASVAVHWEYTGCEENSAVVVNGMTLTSLAGGADDWDQPNDMSLPRPPVGTVPAAQVVNACSLATAALGTGGSFGGAEGGTGVAAGAPVGLDGDAITGAHTPTSRLDDELYDFRRVIRDGDSTVSFGFQGNGDELLSVITLQMLGRVSLTDADGDNYADTAEGDCNTDTDGDGVLDYLDPDSDNDCLPDAMESSAGRTVATVPGSADANCAMSPNGPVCDTRVGQCTCRSNSDCRGTRPFCNTTSRSCDPCTTNAQCATISAAAPLCLTTGASAGSCVQCTATDVSACPSNRRLCDPATSACVGCVTSANCQTPGLPVCDTTARVCRACNTATQASDCPSAALPVCAGAGVNAGNCVACTPDPGGMRGSCADATPLCTTDLAAPNVCVGCNTHGDCAGATPLCDRTTRRCRACTAADCTGATPVCATSGTSTGRCVECTEAQTGACVAPSVCNPATNACVGCTSNADCRDPSRPICNTTNNTCRACDAMSAADCTGPTPACATSGDNAGRCVECTAARAGACTGATPLCNTVTNRCVGCLTDTDCSGATPVCDTTTRACRACRASDCSGARPVCATEGANAGRCVECATGMTAACAAPTVCNTTANMCVGCTANTDCRDPSRPICNTTDNTCRACDAMNAADCTGDRAVCATSGPNQGQCVQCTAERATACAMGFQCDPATNQCVGCLSNADCREPNAPVCNPSTRVCRPCDVTIATDCTGATPVCLASGANAGRCVECSAARAGACAGERPFCDDANNRCVACNTDADCGKGRRCNATDRRCETDPNYRPDAGTPVVDAGMDAGMSPSNQLAGDGCGCRAPGRAGTSAASLWALASFALFATTRRRRRE